jgi:hypothetical protein
MRRFLILVLFVCLVSLPACGGDKSTPTSPSTTTPSPTVTPPQTTPPVTQAVTDAKIVVDPANPDKAVVTLKNGQVGTLSDLQAQAVALYQANGDNLALEVQVASSPATVGPTGFPIPVPFTNLMIIFSQGNGGLGGCIRQTLQHLSVKIRDTTLPDKEEGLIFDLHLTAWKDEAGRLCVGLYESKSGKSWCPCSIDRETLRDALIVCLTVVALALGIAWLGAATAAAIATIVSSVSFPILVAIAAPLPTIPPTNPTTGTINISTTNSASVSCALNGDTFTAPTTLPGQSTGSKTLSCTPPSGFTLTSITPSATQNLSAGGTINFSVNLTATTPPTTPPTTPTTGTVVVSSTNSISLPCNLNGAGFTAPATLSGQSVGSKTLSCTAPSGYNLTAITPSATQTLSAGGTITFAVSLAATPPTTPTTGTINISTTNNVSVSCSLNGASVVAPTTLSGQSAGSKTLSCSAPSGYTLDSIMPSATQTLSAGGMITFSVNLTANTPPTTPPTTPSTGQINVYTNGTVPSMSCSINGVSFTGPTSLSGQSTGSKTLSCSAPSGYTLTSITPSTTQNLSAGGTITFTVSFTANQSPFSASCSFAYSPAVVGQLDAVNMYQTGGVTPVTYVANGAYLGTGSVLNITPVSPGSATVQFVATDATGRTASNSCSVPVIAAPISTGTINVYTNGTVPSMSCNLNGVNFTGPTSLSGQSTGSKTLSCTAPSGFTLTSITPSTTQTLFAGGTITFTVSFAPNAPTVVLSGLAFCRNGTTPAISLGFSVNGGTMNVFDIYRNGSLLYPSNTGTTFLNYPVTAGSTYNYFVVVHLTNGGTVNSNTVSIFVPVKVC